MSDKKVTLDDLNYFWASDGLPIFYADRDDIEDIIEDLGFSIYYLICNIAEDKKVETKTYSSSSTTHYNNTYTVGTPPANNQPTYITEKTTSIVKVVNNIIGRAVSAVSADIADLAPVRETAEYNLPGIPMEIVNRLDDFFRLVDAQHGTESIVLLTFDPSKKDSSGWGVLVPEQTNTSVHCNYNPDSIVEEKPEDVLIVGSVHSHPGMAAYASGTDHADQADFDGIHITYGWQKSVNGGATQYYIEMQMAGNSWTLKPEDVFEGFVSNKAPDSLVVEWSTKVKKVQPPTGGSASLVASQHNHKPLTDQPLTLSQQVTLGSTPVGTTKKGLLNIPVINDPTPHIILAELDPVARDIICPSCEYTMADYDLTAGSCPICDIPVVSMTDDFKEVMIKAEKYMTDRYITGKRSVYLWTIDPKNGEQQVLKIYGSENHYDSSLTKSSATIVETYAPYDDDDDYLLKTASEDGFDADLTVCCFDLPTNCMCKKMVLFDDITDFDLDHRDMDIYSYTSECHNCVYYYTATCPSYYDAIIDYCNTGQRLQNSITECHKFLKHDDTISALPMHFRD